MKQLDDVFGLINVKEVEPKKWMADKKFTLVTSIEQLAAIVDAAIEKGECVIDLETEGLDNRVKPDGTTIHKIVGYCLAYNGDEGFYVPVRHKDKGVKANLDSKLVVPHIKRLCDNAITIYHNSSFDLEFLYGEGIDIDDYQKFEDTLILDYLRNSSDKRHGLKHLSERFLGKEMIELADLYPKNERSRDFSKLDPTLPQVLWYAGSDAICTYLLFDFYRTHTYVPKGKDDKGATIFVCEPESNIKKTIYGSQSGIYAIEKSCVPSIRWMERNRPKIDLPYLKRLRHEVALLIDQSCKEIADGFKKFDIEFEPEDVSSAHKIGKAVQKLTEKGVLKVKLETTDKSGQIKTDEEAITNLVEKVGKTFPFIQQISIFRRLQKVDGTYLKPLQENTDGYIHNDGTRAPCHVLQDSTIRFSFSPHRVDTGRFAASKGQPDQGYSGINVQSIPACYGVGKFTARKIVYRPQGSVSFSKSLMTKDFEDVLDTDFLIRIYDNHFVRDPISDTEYCVRRSCEGCPMVGTCSHGPDEKVKILSLDSAVRPAIVASSPNHSIVAIDESGVELRLAASISQEPKWIDEFYRCSSCGKEYPGPTDLTPDRPAGRKKYKIDVAPPSTCTSCGSDKMGDLHTLTAILVYGEDVVKKPDFKLYRQRSKGSNFAILYGGGGGAVARSTGVTKEEGTFIKNRVLDGLPRLKTWFNEVHQRAHTFKEVETGLGRKLRLADIDHPESWIKAKAERNAVNGIIQGTATGDLTKYAMGAVYAYMKKHGYLNACRLILTIHDELVFDIRNDLMDELFPEIVRIMTQLGTKMGWPVPLACDIEFGPNFNVSYNWNAIHSLNPKTGRASEPLPKFLWNRVHMHPGMWYIDDEGNEVVIPQDDPASHDVEEPILYQEAVVKNDEVALPVFEKELEDASIFHESIKAKEVKVEVADPKHIDDVATTFKNIDKARYKSQAHVGPIFSFQLMYCPGQINGDLTASRSIARTLYQIADFFHTEGTGTHILEVVTWQGSVIIDPQYNLLVNPEEFLVLARYFGLQGGEVR